MKVQDIVDKFGSRKFQILITATVIFYTTDRFSGDHLLFIFCAYMGINVLQKFIEGKK